MAPHGLDLQEVVGSLSGLGFPKERRLCARREFVAVQNSGRRVHTAHFVLIVAKGPLLPSGAEGPSRLGVTVTRKIGSAVRRNRVKRVVREAFRLDPALLPPGVDLVVIAKEGAPTLGLADVQGEWEGVRRLLHRRAQELLTGHKSVPKQGG